MKRYSAVGLLVLLAGCHFDKLFSGGDRPLSYGTPVGLTFYRTPTSARAGQAISPAVQVGVVDSVNNPAAGVDSLIEIRLGDPNPGGASLSGTTTVHAVNGTATFTDLSIDRPGSGYTLIASGAKLPEIRSSPFTVEPGPPATLRFTTQPGGTMTDSAIKPAVQVAAFDASNNAATNFTGPVRLTLGNANGATLSGGGPVNAVAGVATFSNLRVNKAGSGYTLRAALGAAAPVAESNAFAIASTPPPPPPTGDLTVTTTTNGPSPDPDGYTVTLDGNDSRPIANNGSVTFQGLPEGSHTVTLSGVATNCSVTGGPSQQATVTANSTVTAAFSVTCVATSGSIAVTTSSSGSPADPDGYTVTVDGGGGPSQGIGDNGSATFADLSSGNHTVALSGVAANCFVSGGPSRTVNVTAGGTTPVTFTVTCMAPPVVTAGQDQQVAVGLLFQLEGASFNDPDNDGPWTITIDWGDGSSPTSFQRSTEGAIVGNHSYPVTLLGATYTLRVTVEDAHGLRGSATKNVQVIVT